MVDKTDYDELLEYCKNNIDVEELSNSDCMKKYEIAMTYLLTDKIHDLDERDLELIMKFATKQQLQKWNLGNIDVIIDNGKILDKNELGQCRLRPDKTQDIVYAYKLIEKAVKEKGNPVNLIQLLTTVFHETTHVAQNYIICNEMVNGDLMPRKQNGYIMAIEKVVRYVNEDFYQKNYSNIYAENHANKIGIMLALNFFYHYADKGLALSLFEAYKDNMQYYETKCSVNSDMQIYGKTFRKNRIMQVKEFLCKCTLKKKPILIEQFPLLKVAYKEDGSRKDILELLEDRKKRIKEEIKTPDYDENIINDLYRTIILSRDYNNDEWESAIDQMEKYCFDNNIQDEYFFELIKSLYMYNVDINKPNNDENTERYIQILDNYITQFKSEILKKIAKNEQTKPKSNLGLNAKEEK